MQSCLFSCLLFIKIVSIARESPKQAIAGLRGQTRELFRLSRSADQADGGSRPSPGYGGCRPKCKSRQDECYDMIVDDPAVDAVAGHRFNDRPFLPKESRRLVNVQGLHLDATRPPSTIVRDLKEEGIAIAVDRPSFFLHSVSPLIARPTGADCIFNFDFRTARL